MDIDTGRADHMEDYLVRLHTGQWFRWTDSKNKIYANLRLSEKVGIGGNIVDNLITELPTEQECTDGLTQLQADFDAKEYARNRQAEYPSIQECVHAILDDDLENLQILRQAVKEKFPKT